MAGSERDAGFCSGGDEDDMSGLHSPSASEDSVEVQVTPISLRNKRKLAEPRKIQEPCTAPLKKRRFERVEEAIVPDEEESRTARSPSPFRPWSSSRKSTDPKISEPIRAEQTTVSAQSTTASSLSSSALPAAGPSLSSRIHENHEDDLDRVENGDRNIQTEEYESQHREDLPPRLRQSGQNRQPRAERRESKNFDSTKDPLVVASTTTENSALSLISTPAVLPATHPRLQEEPLALVLRGEIATRVPSHPAVNGSYERACSYSVERANVSSASSSASSSSSSSSSSFASSSLLLNRPENHRSGANGCDSAQTMTTTTTTTTTSNPQTGHPRQHPTAGQQRNYKNMTRERRIEANARERTRVHTISAAFDTLRRAIPAYSHNQKLSKLSVLRIACSYIMTLGKIVNTPEGEPTNGASLGACVDLVSRTIQTEGKLRKRKED
ncbi:atonal bHLH transcription factor 8-like protein net isoform X2 [Ptiloglossa arizonensis]